MQEKPKKKQDLTVLKSVFFCEALSVKGFLIMIIFVGVTFSNTPLTNYLAEAFE